jgi:hypothetical protein
MAGRPCFPTRCHDTVSQSWLLTVRPCHGFMRHVGTCLTAWQLAAAVWAIPSQAAHPKRHAKCLRCRPLASMRSACKCD